MQPEHFDVVVVGAGISGIGAGCHLRAKCPDRTFVILEGRADIGGTWDLFRYPGIRSDSDMSTFGYNFRPWRESKVLADGPSIKRYVTETAEKYGVTPHIRFSRKVTNADWSSEKARWTVTAQNEETGEDDDSNHRTPHRGTPLVIWSLSPTTTDPNRGIIHLDGAHWGSRRRTHGGAAGPALDRSRPGTAVCTGSGRAGARSPPVDRAPAGS